MLSHQHILSRAKDGRVVFYIAVNWQDTGVGVINTAVEEQVKDGHLLTDLSYTPLGLDGQELMVEVSASTEMYNEENFTS